MTRQRKTYSEEFKREAVKLLVSSDKTLNEVADELDVPVSALCNWKVQYARGKKNKSETAADVSAENLKLKRELDRLKKEKEILKKAAAFFARDSL